MLGCFWTSIFNFVFVDPAFDDAYLARSSASIFWLLGTCVNSIWLNSYVKSFVNLMYFCILSSFTSYTPFIYPTISFESLWRSKFLTSSAFSTLSSVSTPSFLTSLLVARNVSWTSYLSISPNRVMIMTPTLPLFRVDEPLVWIVHLSTSFSAPSSSGIVNSAMKSVSACALIAVLGW